MIELLEYSSKPQTVRAVQLTTENAAEIANYLGGILWRHNPKQTQIHYRSDRQPALYAMNCDSVLRLGSWLVESPTARKSYKDEIFQMLFAPEAASPKPAVQEFFENYPI